MGTEREMGPDPSGMIPKPGIQTRKEVRQFRMTLLECLSLDFSTHRNRETPVR